MGDTYRTFTGSPIGEPHAVLRVGNIGPLLLSDFHYIDLLAHLVHERIPERVVHARGAGAHGYFKLTQSLSDITSSSFFTDTTKTHKVTVRFSTVSGELGSADTFRDARGFAVKIYTATDEGNFDWVFLSTPIFGIRDPAKFPPKTHSQKRNPQTHLPDPEAFWDFLTQNPETAHQISMLFTDRGTPDGYHNIHGYLINTYKFVKSDGNWVYAKIHLKKVGGTKNLSSADARRIAGENPNYGIQKLIEAVQSDDKPKWDVSIQTMTPQQADTFKYNVLDPTKTWPHAEYPLQKIGELVLTGSVTNYFAEVEQIAFSPANIVPYFEPSADPILQARFFAYGEAQRYRLGVNFNQLAINKPNIPVANFQRDGFMAIDNQGSRPNYNSSFNQLNFVKNSGSLYGNPRDADRSAEHEQWIAGVYWDLINVTKDDFEQPKIFVTDVLNDTERATLVDNIWGSVQNVKSNDLQRRILVYWANIHQPTSDALAERFGINTEEPATITDTPVHFEYRQECPARQIQ